jgi:hypothetical protein
MRWVLPGGAVLGGSNRKGEDWPVVCRPQGAVLERTIPSAPIAHLQPESIPTATVTLVAPPAPVPDPSPPKPTDRLGKVKLFLEILGLLVGLISAILALFGLSRK